MEPGDVENGDIKIVDEAMSNLAEDHPQYAALTYCWGTATENERGLLKTTKENISEMVQGVASSDLPVVFPRCGGDDAASWYKVLADRCSLHCSRRP